MSSAGEQTFMWRRFWLPRSAPVELERGCFLWDPEGEFTRHLNPEAVALGELDHRVAILLGEPGIGKSHGVRAHAAAATNVGS